MSILQFKNAIISFEDRVILRDANFKLDKGDRVALIGKNGTGKTSIIKAILGEIDLAEGSVRLDLGISIGYFSQFSRLEGDVSIMEHLTGLFSEETDIETKLDAIEAKITAGEEDLDPLLSAQAELLDRMTVLDGWDRARRIDTVLTMLKFSDQHRQCPIKTLSGGWRNRSALAEILLKRVDILLLDEPTNFLDTDGVEWLSSWLRKFHGSCFMISHDREFLDECCDRVLEIESGHVHEYHGNYSEYVKSRSSKEKTMQSLSKMEFELLHAEAQMVQQSKKSEPMSRRNLQRKLCPKPVKQIITTIYSSMTIPNKLLNVEKISKSFGEHQIFKDVSFTLNRGQIKVIYGANGQGKSTILNALCDQFKCDSGEIIWPRATEFISFSETLEGLDPDKLLSKYINTIGMALLAPKKKVSAFLDMLGFTNEEKMTKIGKLSGGQKARAALATCLLSGCQVLLLDEPTNHLDLNSIRIIEQALIHFPGGVIVVSHDRFFIDKIASSVLVLDDGKVLEFSGNWSSWVKSQKK